MSDDVPKDWKKNPEAYRAFKRHFGDPLEKLELEKLERNKRVQERYDALMAEGEHGHYETMFRVVREEVERALADKADKSAGATRKR